ncbi:MAG: glycosyltransferase family 2 protein [Pseudomonadota bacterium]
MTRPAISAIVVSYNTGGRLRECLYALCANPGISEILIVDNGNPETDQAWIARFARDRDTVRVLTGHGNVGFGAGVNLGVQAARGPHLLIINPDAVLRYGSLEALQETASHTGTPWIVGGKIFDLFGREERGPRRRELTLFRAATSVLGVNTWTLEAKPAPSNPIEMPVISGAFFLTDLDSMAVLNGFDDAYFLHVEDVDLCRRCRVLGGEVWYDPRAGALHYGSTSDAPSGFVERHKADGLAHYFRKFAEGPFHRLMIELALPLMHLGRYLRPR